MQSHRSRKDHKSPNIKLISPWWWVRVECA